MEEKAPNYRRIALGAILVALVAGGVLVYLYYMQLQKQQNNLSSFQASFKAGQDLLKTGRSGATLRFTEALNQAKTKEDEAVAKLNLGVAYLQSDPVQGVKILKEVSVDTSYPPFYRAGAGEQVLRYFMGARDIKFAFGTIFTGPTWADFASGVVQDRRGAELAARKGYEWVVSLFSIFPAEYRISWWYSKQIAEKNVPSGQTGAYIAEAKKHLELGDKAFNAGLNDPATFRSAIALGYILKGVVLEYLYSAQQATAADVTTLYKQAISYLDKDTVDSSYSMFMPYARYQLAEFWIRTNTGQRDEVLATLAPLYVSLQGGFYTYAASLANKAIFGDDSARKGMVTVAGYDPKFKDMLTKLGWKESDIAL